MYIRKDFGMSIWLKNGAPAHKLVLGIPLFARTFLLARTDRNDLHSPTIGNGTEGPFTRSAGFLSYFEVNRSLTLLFNLLWVCSGLFITSRSEMDQTNGGWRIWICLYVQRSRLDFLWHHWKYPKASSLCRCQQSRRFIRLVSYVYFFSLVITQILVVFFLVDMDDFSGVFCNNGSYPYIKNSLSLLPTHMSSYI